MKATHKQLQQFVRDYQGETWFWAKIQEEFDPHTTECGACNAEEICDRCIDTIGEDIAWDMLTTDQLEYVLDANDEVWLMPADKDKR